MGLLDPQHKNRNEGQCLHHDNQVHLSHHHKSHSELAIVHVVVQVYRCQLLYQVSAHYHGLLFHQHETRPWMMLLYMEGYFASYNYQAF